MIADCIVSDLRKHHVETFVDANYANISTSKPVPQAVEARLAHNDSPDRRAAT
jgi:hypothetical protein